MRCPWSLSIGRLPGPCTHQLSVLCISANVAWKETAGPEDSSAQLRPAPTPGTTATPEHRQPRASWDIQRSSSILSSGPCVQLARSHEVGPPGPWSTVWKAPMFLTSYSSRSRPLPPASGAVGLLTTPSQQKHQEEGPRSRGRMEKANTHSTEA